MNEADSRESVEKEYAETVAALNEALADIDDPDKWLSHDEVFGQLRKKFNIAHAENGQRSGVDGEIQKEKK